MLKKDALCLYYIGLLFLIKLKLVRYQNNNLISFSMFLVMPGTDKEGRLICFERPGKYLKYC